MKFGYTIIYVSDVLQTVAFYEEAFGINRRFVHESTLYAEMETGETALAFASEDMAERNDFAIAVNRKASLAAAWEVCFVTDDVSEAFDRAVKAGATPISAPAEKPWGQTVCYVRDLNGCLVEMASPVLK